MGNAGYGLICWAGLDMGRPRAGLCGHGLAGLGYPYWLVSPWPRWPWALPTWLSVGLGSTGRGLC